MHRRKLRHRYGRAGNGPAQTLSSLKSHGFAFWQNQPTLESGHFDNLKYNDGKHRVWVSRQTLADYGGNRRAWMEERITFEKFHNGNWVKA
jgi:hypothetical protein